MRAYSDENWANLTIVSDDDVSKSYYYDNKFCNYISNIVHLGLMTKLLKEVARKQERPVYWISPKRKYSDSTKRPYYRFSLDEAFLIIAKLAADYDTLVLPNETPIEIAFQPTKLPHYIKEIREDPCFRLYLEKLSYCYGFQPYHLTEMPVAKGSSIFVRVDSIMSMFHPCTKKCYREKDAFVFNRVLMAHNLSKEFGNIKIHDKASIIIHEYRKSNTPITGLIADTMKYIVPAKEALLNALSNWKGAYFDYRPKIKIKFKKIKTTSIPEEYVDINITFRKLHKELS